MCMVYSTSSKIIIQTSHIYVTISIFMYFTTVCVTNNLISMRAMLNNIATLVVVSMCLFALPGNLEQIHITVSAQCMLMNIGTLYTLTHKNILTGDFAKPKQPSQY